MQAEQPEALDLIREANESWASLIRRRRLARMRLGQASAEYTSLMSDPEFRIALVPLTEAEFQEAFSSASEMPVGDNVAGVLVRERRARVEQVYRSCRSPGDLSEPMFSSYEEFREATTTADVDHLLDVYEEMTHNQSPTMDGISPEELELLKKALQEMDWSALSGRSWYAAKRFLFSIFPEQPTGSLLGSFSTMTSTGTSENQKSTPTV